MAAGVEDTTGAAPGVIVFETRVGTVVVDAATGCDVMFLAAAAAAVVVATAVVELTGDIDMG